MKSDPFIEKHLDRINKIKAELKDQHEKEGEITANVLIRQTNCIRDGKGNIIFNEKELVSWFKNSAHLADYTIYDTM